MEEWRESSRRLAEALHANGKEQIEVDLRIHAHQVRLKELSLVYAAEQLCLEPLEARAKELERRNSFLHSSIRELEERHGDCAGYAFDECGHLEPASLSAALATLRLPRLDSWKEERERQITVPRGENLASDDIDAIRALRRHLANAGDCRALWTRADELRTGQRVYVTPIDTSRTRNLAN